MKSSPSILTWLALLMAGGSAALGQASGNAEDAVLAADAAWLNVYVAKDLDKSVAFCDDEGSLLVTGSPIATGKAAITKAIASDFANSRLVWHPNKVGVARSGELGYTSGTYEMRFKDRAGKMVLDQGKYLTVWKKEADGSWKVLFDMFNTDLPPSPSPPPG